MKISRKLRDRRSELGYTQYQVALRAEMSAVQYNGYENDRHVPSEGTLRRLAKALNTTVDELRDDQIPREMTAVELKDAFRHKLAQELGISPSSIEIFVKWS
jgi:transcriptional regulator with XRE-family HTH domain